MENNSSDQTRKVAEGFCRRHPSRFRYMFEPLQGKSYALNTAIREAQGEVLAFMDGDVPVEPRWLQDLTAALHNGESAGTGGRVAAEWACMPTSKLALTACRNGISVLSTRY